MTSYFDDLRAEVREASSLREIYFKLFIGTLGVAVIVLTLYQIGLVVEFFAGPVPHYWGRNSAAFYSPTLTGLAALLLAATISLLTVVAGMMIFALGDLIVKRWDAR